MIEDPDSPKLPPLPTFKRVGKSQVVKRQKAAKSSSKKPAKCVRKKAKPNQSANTQVSGLKFPVSSLSPATRHSLPVTAAEQLSAQVAELKQQIAALCDQLAASHSPLHHSVDAQRKGGPLPVTAAQHPPSTTESAVAALSEQVAALCAQLATRHPLPATAAKPLPIYELKETRPVGYQARDILDSTTDESQDSYSISFLDQILGSENHSEWNLLCLIDPLQIEHHPDRARLALFAAVAQSQVGDPSRAKSLVRKALDWDCSRQQAIRLLMAITYRNLSEANTLNFRGKKASKMQSAATLLLNPRTEAVSSGLVVEYGSKQRIGNSLTKKRKFQKITPECVILVAGMRHSGSTALFNIIRLGIEKSGYKYVSGYSEHDYLASKIRQSGCIGLIKTHEFRDDLLGMADVIFTSRRDLRDTVASAVRRDFHLVKKMGNSVEYAKYNRSIYDSWASKSDFEFVYEQFIINPNKSIEEILGFLGLDKNFTKSICGEVLNLPKNNYKTTLLSETHITNPEHNMSYKDTLSEEAVSMINANHYLWLKQFYPER